MGRQRILCVVTVVAALVAATPAAAQRLSLGERVTLLENKANVENQQAVQGNIEAQNRIVQLQSEVQSLRNTVETLQNEIEQLKRVSRQQAIDFDERLARLESGGAAAPVSPQTPAAAATAAPATPAAQAPSTATADAGPAPQVAPADPAAEEADYQAALDALVERFEADESARLFLAFLRDHPESALVPNAYYWLGESYYVTQNYELALEAFQTLLGQHAGSRKEADALLKLGYCQIALGQRAAGEASLRQVSERFAGTDAAGKAESRLRTLALENR
ncbi:MAG TPA: tol-pal system protein YbgF [Arenimonas sp.]|uniref:tol-pal system protein YbgF n=1 Tax=Arenimonas sp. TaxID=1872635 RepID=UPI002D80B4B4|nr:tol-pal system protein YbgF [Arenimonas sp.]HEU0153291.1 tol-pal system protein YbgF [Arenimonas sp.]